VLLKKKKKLNSYPVHW